MNSLIVASFTLLVAAAMAAPLDEASPIPIVSRSGDGPNPDGSFNWSYETGNGIQAQEQGELKKSQDGEGDVIAVQGSYRYTDNEGNPYVVTYTADENGFQPQGDHLPKGPEIPPAILKALEWIAAHPEEDNLTK